MISEGIDPQLAKAEQKAMAIVEKNATFLSVAEQWKATKEGRIKEKTLHDNLHGSHYGLSEINRFQSVRNKSLLMQGCGCNRSKPVCY